MFTKKTKQTEKPTENNEAEAAEQITEETSQNENQSFEPGQEIIFTPTPEQLNELALHPKTPGNIERPETNGQYLLKLRGQRGNVQLGAVYSENELPGTFKTA